MSDREKPIRRSAYAPAQRLEILRLALEATGAGLGYREMMERLEVTEITVRRSLQALQATCDVEEQELDGRKLFRIRPPKPSAVRFTLMEIVSLALLRCVSENLAGTGIDGDVDSAIEKLHATLLKHDVPLARSLDKKLFLRPFGRRKYQERLDDMTEVMTALLHEQRLEITYDSPASGGEETHLFDPYTLVLYKTGLYIAGRSYRYKSDKVISLALDSLKGVRWRKGERFEYPKDYHPKQLDQGGLGLFGGEPLDVRLAFDAKVSRFVLRAEWHRTQEDAVLPDGRTLLTMQVNGTIELTSWILSWGPTCEVLGPPKLRAMVKEELLRAHARYV